MSEVLLLTALRESQAALPVSSKDWTTLLQQARKCDLLPRLATELLASRGWEGVPGKAREQLEAALAVADHHQRAIRWEVNRIQAALRGLDCPLVLLKGAAYLMLDLPMAAGRLVSDVDILVPRTRLDEVEASLRKAGWEQLKPNDYDDHYYRKWMHELPPLKHVDRDTIVDVHHNILPISGRLHPDAQKLIRAALPLPDSQVLTLCPKDMVLHAAVHLFQDGEVAGQLRDLSDLDLLMRHFSQEQPDFWQQLTDRAKELQLCRPLYYTLKLTHRLLQTPVPASVLDSLHDRPIAIVGRCMEQLAATALVPTLKPPTWGSSLAGRILWARAHWLRMPPWILLPHLMHKSLRRWFIAK